MLSRRMILAALLSAAAFPARGADQRVTLFATASLKTALDALVAPLQAQHGIALRCVYASSAALARQIEQGAPADLFWSADREWMDWCVERQLVRKDTIADVLGNRLVLIAPADAAMPQLALTPDALRTALGDGRMAVGETRSVPAGRYAKEALEKLGLWEFLHASLAETDNVRAALVLTARGEAPLGIVYASDAVAERRVKIVAEFPATSHKPIVYPLAMTRDANAVAKTVIEFLLGATARSVYVREGFSILATPSPT